VGEVLRSLSAPLAFLLLAVPMSLLLDRLGYFHALAERVLGERDSRFALWMLAAVVTASLNLDAAVVLLTPLYIRIAQRAGAHPEPFAFMPVLQACLASSPLPISNLTNLIVQERVGVPTSAFVRWMGLPTLVMVLVGWLVHRRSVPPLGRLVDERSSGDRRALVWGSGLTALLVLGFVAGERFGIRPWVVVLLVDLVLVALTRHLPLREVPLATALAVLGAGAAIGLLLEVVDLRALFVSAHAPGILQSVVVGSIATAACNNLPAVLLGLHYVDGGGSRLWAYLLAVNVGPALVLHGSLAGLLWQRTACRLGVRVGALRYSAVGLRVGGPALLAGTLALWAISG